MKVHNRLNNNNNKKKKKKRVILGTSHIIRKVMQCEA